MVERLKHAIERARAQREALLAGAAPAPAPEQAAPGAAAVAPENSWSALEEMTLDAKHLERERIVTRAKSDPATSAFDLLRTRLMRVCETQGWSRIGITSPTMKCGKTVLCANLAFSFARQSGYRTMVLDFDLKSPRLGPALGVTVEGSMGAFLRGAAPASSIMRRYGDNLAFGFAGGREQDSAELIQSAKTEKALVGLHAEMKPDISLYDLPPVLGVDDVLAFLENLDGLLLVAAAGQTKSSEIEECERLFADSTNFLGVVLNKCEDADYDGYHYGYGAD